MGFTESGTFVIHVAVLAAGIVYLIAVLMFPDVVFGVIAWATGAIANKIAHIGAGYGGLFVDLHTLPKRRATMRSKIIGVLRRWWAKVRDAFRGLDDRQPPRIRDLVAASAANGGQEE